MRHVAEPGGVVRTRAADAKHSASFTRAESCCSSVLHADARARFSCLSSSCSRASAASAPRTCKPWPQTQARNRRLQSLVAVWVSLASDFCLALARQGGGGLTFTPSKRAKSHSRSSSSLSPRAHASSPAHARSASRHRSAAQQFASASAGLAAHTFAETVLERWRSQNAWYSYSSLTHP
eukprot:3621630-Rhodomonas_salina.2